MKYWLIWATLLVACARTPDQPPLPVTCADPLAGCRIGDGLELRFSHTPSAMQAFDLEIVAPQETPVHASFQMRGMEMGMNRYRLLWEQGKWRAKVMLPACVQGRHDWLLRLEVDGRAYEIPFKAG